MSAGRVPERTGNDRPMCAMASLRIDHLIVSHGFFSGSRRAGKCSPLNHPRAVQRSPVVYPGACGQLRLQCPGFVDHSAEFTRLFGENPCAAEVPDESSSVQPQKKHFGPDFSRIRAEMSVARCAPPPRASKRLRRASPCRGIPRSRPRRAEPHRRSRRSRRARPSRGRPRAPRGP